MKTYEIRNIVQIWLEENGFDGLCEEDYECGCEISELMPCDEPRPGCMAGHKKKDETGEYDFVIVPGEKHNKSINRDKK